jgi:protein phosphatase
MGSTLLAARIRGDEIAWISVGDSPLYLVFADRLERLNADHSMAPQIDALAARGVITREEAAGHPGRHTLREAVMGDSLTLVDEGQRRVVPGAMLLLCSDGIESLPHERIVAAAGMSVGGLIDAVLAARRQHQDNITVIKLDRPS